MADQATNAILTMLRYIMIETSLLRLGAGIRARATAPVLIDRLLYKAYNVQIHDSRARVNLDRRHPPRAARADGAAKRKAISGTSVWPETIIKCWA